MKDTGTYGLLAEFDNVNDAIIAARRTITAKRNFEESVGCRSPAETASGGCRLKFRL